MKKWIYVEARDMDDLTGMPEPVSFWSVQFEAVDAEEAYQKGAALMDTERTMLLALPARTAEQKHFEGSLLNDYVVEVQ